MTTILPFMRDAVFEPKDIQSMSMALDDVCTTLNVGDGHAREVIAGAHHHAGAERGAQSYDPSGSCPQGGQPCRRGRQGAVPSVVGSVTAERANRILIAEAQVARQRDLIERLETQRADTTDAKSLLSALKYTLKVLRRHQRPRLAVIHRERSDA
jgi:hypothetical protein